MPLCCVIGPAPVTPRLTALAVLNHTQLSRDPGVFLALVVNVASRRHLGPGDGKRIKRQRRRKRRNEIATPGQHLQHWNSPVSSTRTGTCRFLRHAGGAARESSPGLSRNDQTSLYSTWRSANDDIDRNGSKLEIQGLGCATHGQY